MYKFIFYPDYAEKDRHLKGRRGLKYRRRGDDRRCWESLPAAQVVDNRVRDGVSCAREDQQQDQYLRELE